MLYLDYAANTPVDEEVLETFTRITRDYYGNPNGKYQSGRDAGQIIEEASDTIKGILEAEDMEVIYTSGATEANNLALKGAARCYRENGRHIISTSLEHSSVSGALTYLQTQGYEIDLVDLDEKGQVDLAHLKELLRSDTILVSVCLVDSELGMRQPIEKISRILEENPNCFFHVDATQGVGKIPVSAKGIDMMSFAPHKFYGLNGSGVLLKKEDIILEPLLHGGNSTTIYRSGTPVPAEAAAAAKALQLADEHMERRLAQVRRVKEWVQEGLEKYSLIRINSSDEAIPYFLNVSIKGVRAGIVQEALDQQGIYISPKSACSTPNTPSRAVYAVTRDRKNAMHSWRLSFSHRITQEDVDRFLDSFAACYKELTT